MQLQFQVTPAFKAALLDNVRASTEMNSNRTLKTIQDDILSYREMCDAENVQTLQRGMNFRLGRSYSVIHSQRPGKLRPIWLVTMVTRATSASWSETARIGESARFP